MQTNVEPCYDIAHFGHVELLPPKPANPPVEYGLALITDRLLAAGFSEDEL